VASPSPGCRARICEAAPDVSYSHLISIEISQALGAGASSHIERYKCISAAIEKANFELNRRLSF
jgi:hypothetical protein